MCGKACSTIWSCRTGIESVPPLPASITVEARIAGSTYAMESGQLRTVLRHLRRVVGPPQAGGLSDAELLDRFVTRRDEAAFEVLVWRHGPLVLNVCRRVLRHHHDAEDAFQATFLA